MNDHLPNTDIWMTHPDLALAPRLALPAGYRMRFYREGDVQTWVRVQQAAETFFVPTAEHFARSMPGDAALLATRVMFLVDPAGTDIGTITAWHNDDLLGRPIGQIHWVAIMPEAQGRGLARPMLSAACDELRAHGHAEACLDTNARRLPALNLYLAAGFRPYPRDEAQREAWREIAPRLRYSVAPL